MEQALFLDLYVNPKKRGSAANDFNTFANEPLDGAQGWRNSLEEQRYLLPELMDKNYLYENLSENNDAQFNGNEKDIASNGRFFGE